MTPLVSQFSSQKLMLTILMSICLGRYRVRMNILVWLIQPINSSWTLNANTRTHYSDKEKNKALKATYIMVKDDEQKDSLFISSGFMISLLSWSCIVSSHLLSYKNKVNNIVISNIQKNEKGLLGTHFI